ncbi:hypothetical protein MY11210_008691 [Beauveria gryllotalpidicola]
MMLSTTHLHEPRQAGPTNSHSAAFPHDPRLRLEALTEPRDMSHDDCPFTAHVNQPKLAPHLIDVHIPSPALSPLSLPAPVLPITHHVAVSPTHDAVSPLIPSEPSTKPEDYQEKQPQFMFASLLAGLVAAMP